MRIPLGLRIIAIFKLVSGCLLFAVGIGLLRSLDGVGETAEHLVRWLHLDPARPAVAHALAYASGMSMQQLRLIDAATFFYALLYIIEGVGLLRAAHWAEYLVIVATGLLIPFEIYEVIEKTTLTRVAILVINLTIVAYLVRTLINERRAKMAAGH